MSQEFMDPEIFSDFIVEAKEHLETIEPNLLELEKNPENLSLLNDIFRPMHSLKGASGFLGLNTINALAHKAESVMDELRKGSMAVNAGVMDVILSATDALRTMIESLEVSGVEGDLDTSPILTRLEAVLAGETLEPALAPAAAPEPEPVAEEAVLPEEEIQDQAPAPEPDTAEKKTAFRITINPDFRAEPYLLTAVGEGHLADFLEEAHEIIENLNSSLLELEKQPSQGGELINDIFRYFHNLKGNSGIIGYRELNALTHEAETLLNKVRKDEIPCNHALIDLLLAVVDMIEALIGNVEASLGRVVPLDIASMVEVLQRAVEEGGVFGPVEIEGRDTPDSAQDAPADEPQENIPAAAKAPASAAPAPAAPAASAGEIDPEDMAIFEQTVQQQLDNIALAMETLRKDATQKDYIDGLYRSLVTIQNSTGYMGLDDIKTYATATAGLVDMARSSDMGFDLMLDLLDQETAIVRDMLLAGLEKLKGSGAAPAAPAPAPKPAPKPEPKPAPKAEAKPATKAEPKPESKPAPKPEPKAESKPEPKPAPVAAPRPAAPAAPPAPVAPAAPAAAAAVDPKAGAKVSTTIRVDHQKLDHLMNLIGELIINRNRYSMIARALEEGQQDVQSVAQQLTETTYAMARISDDLQDTIMNVRMVPVSTVFSRFPRLVRDLSRKSGKEVDLIMEGEETELDKSVVEEIGDPLVHLIRNSMDHGVEPEEDRLAVGKSPRGHVWLRAYHKGNSVAIEVEDDGRGIDPEKMRAVGVKKGLVTPEEARNLDDREAVDLIFAPGFSSAEKVTDISGRGVGMDVVRNNIKNLKGNVNISTEVGKGSKFTLTLPLTLAIIDALMVQVNGMMFAIPLDAVSETTKIETERLTDVNSRKAVTLRGEVLGIVELAELLDQPMNTEERDILPVVVIHDNDRRLGLVVDRLLERQEIVIKPLGHYLNQFELRGVSGATIMGDGSVVLILDPHEVHSMATNPQKA